MQIAMMAVQFSGLLIGVVQFYRYRDTTDCFKKAFFPWLLIGILGGPVSWVFS